MQKWREQLADIIFEADTPAGNAFDIVLLITILISLLAVMLESVTEIRDSYGPLLQYIEWTVTVMFSIEYIARIITAERAKGYVFSFYGIIDLLSILPTYLSLFVGGAQYLMAVRTLRLIRVFRVLKLVRYTRASSMLLVALRASRAKIIVFLGTVLTLVIIMGTVMYLVEGGESGFTSIPRSIYWTIVTITTVGYGDIAPQTVLGQFIASILMIIGYGVIAVPTGIVSVEYSKAAQEEKDRSTCFSCGTAIKSPDAKFCRMCGQSLKG